MVYTLANGLLSAQNETAEADAPAAIEGGAADEVAAETETKHEA
jgi:hypothetical protein